MEVKEAKALSLIPDEPVEPRLVENDHVQLDFSWIMGWTCGESFSKLTVNDRWFLHVYYHEGSKTAEVLGISRKTLYNRLKRIKEKIYEG